MLLHMHTTRSRGAHVLAVCAVCAVCACNSDASPKARAVAEKIAIHASQKQSSSARSKLLQRVFRVAVRVSRGCCGVAA